MSNIHFQVEIPSLPQQNSNAKYRIDSVKKNLLNDILSFNMQASEQQKRQKFQRSIAERKQSQRVNEQMQRQYQIQKQLQGKRKQLLRQNLVREYENQIQAQREVKRREKQKDWQYQKVQVQSNKFEDQRRLNDLMRMYRGNRFDVLDSRQPTKNQYRLRDQVKTEPSQEINSYQRNYLRSQQAAYNKEIRESQQLDSIKKNNYQAINPETPNNKQIHRSKHISFNQYQGYENQTNFRNEDSRMRQRNLSFNNIQQVKIQPAFSKNQIDSLDYLKYMEDRRKKQYKQELDEQVRKKNTYSLKRNNQF